MTCKKCGNFHIQENDKFCNQCGEPLDKATPGRKVSDAESAPEGQLLTNAPLETNINSQASVTKNENIEHGHKAQELPYPNKPSGVGGFLKFFVIVGCIIGPILGLLAGFGEISSTETEFPGLRDSDDWSDFKAIAYTSSFIGMALLFWLASLLYGSELRSTKFKAIGILWVAGPLLRVGEALAVLTVLPSHMSGALSSELFIGIFSSGVVVIIWTLYFLLSKRVANTYWR